MAGLIISTWAIGLAGAGLISAVIRSDSPRVVRAGRIGLAFLLAIELFVAAIFFVAPKGSGGLSTPTESSSWWIVALGCGIPVALLCGVAVWRAYAGHRVALISAALATAALYLAFPLGFVPPHDALTGLGRFEHSHHALDVVAIFLPTLILLASEALRGAVAAPDEEGASIVALLRRAPRRVVVGGVVVVAAVVAFELASGLVAALVVCGGLLGLFVVGVWRTHVASERMRHGFER